MYSIQQQQVLPPPGIPYSQQVPGGGGGGECPPSHMAWVPLGQQQQQPPPPPSPVVPQLGGQTGTYVLDPSRWGCFLTIFFLLFDENLSLWTNDEFFWLATKFFCWSAKWRKLKFETFCFTPCQTQKKLLLQGELELLRCLSDKYFCKNTLRPSKN